jgi:hypothetical protein
MWSIQRYLLFAPLFILSLTSYGQKLFEGYVLDENEVALPYTHVVNLNKGTGQISGENGFFSIQAETKDSIRFSFVGYSTLIIVVSEEMFTREINVTLRPDYVELPSIWVFSNPKYLVPKKPILPSIRMGPLPEYKNTKPIDPGDFVFKPFAVTKMDGQMLPTIGPSITLHGPFTYLSKEEKEKRKAEEAYLKTLETISFAKLMALKQTRDLLKNRYELNDSALDSIIVMMNQEVPSIQEIKEPEKIFASVDRFVGQKLSQTSQQSVRP